MRSMKEIWRKGKVILTVMAVLLSFGLTGCAAMNPVDEGVEFLKSEKYQEAQGKFQEAVDAGTDVGEAYRGLGLCYWEQKEYKKAQEAFKLAQENGVKETATLYNLLGLCAVKLDETDQAIQYFEEGQKFPDAEQKLLQEMTFNLIVLYERKDDWGAAKKKLEEYVARFPGDERAEKELEFFNTQVPEKEDGE